jgi:predicted PurR-regulated permease PerM
LVLLLVLLLLVVAATVAAAVTMLVMATTTTTTTIKMMMTKFVDVAKEQHRHNARATPEQRELMASALHRRQRASQTTGLRMFTKTDMFTSP